MDKLFPPIKNYNKDLHKPNLLRKNVLTSVTLESAGNESY